MGGQTRPGEAPHSYNGTWSGDFFDDSAAGTADDDPHPDSVAGTFGVTRTVDDTTESFVGAFGAHQD